ncbi:MAG: PilZ domain-containing protein [Deltaproteobacteria bacterium]
MNAGKNESAARSGRRSKRPMMRIPIEVHGTDASGQAFSETTHTVGVNRNGARISLRNSPLPGARITITNLAREESCAFRVVDRTATTYGDHAEWGVECLEPDRNFWGINFPEVTPGAPHGEGIDVMLECAECHARELAQLTMQHYRELSVNSALIRECSRCGRPTKWEFGFAEVLPEESLRKAPASVAAALRLPGGKDRRQTKRYVAMLPVRLRTDSGKMETARSENLCKLGLCFVSEIPLEPGDTIYLSVGPLESGKKELPARVAWRRPVTGSDRSLIGVRLEAEDLA